MLNQEGNEPITGFQLGPLALHGREAFCFFFKRKHKPWKHIIICLDETLTFCIILNGKEVFISAIEIFVVVESFFS
jgi:hypothetical protein